MVEAGEDPRFIARRLIILASEDIGLADPQALVIASAAADAVAFIGMPEGRIPLAEATVYLALAPKSNASYRAINQAISDVRSGKAGHIPAHLRDAHYPGAASLGHGVGYRYSHDDPRGVVTQSYLPDSLLLGFATTNQRGGAQKPMRQIATRPSDALSTVTSLETILPSVLE